MAVHSFICDACDNEVTDTTARGVHICPECGQDMRWDVRLGGHTGDYYHTSHSMAIHPDQTAEHHRDFPDVNVHKDGTLGFTSPKIQERYAHAQGFDKLPQKGKSRLGRTRIA